MYNYEIGQIVKSKAGRDKGKIFIIFDVQNEYVYLVDGIYRRIEHPKKKKIKHIQGTNTINEDLKRSIINGSKVTNSDVRKALELYYNNQIETVIS